MTSREKAISIVTMVRSNILIGWEDSRNISLLMVDVIKDDNKFIMNLPLECELFWDEVEMELNELKLTENGIQ